MASLFKKRREDAGRTPCIVEFECASDTLDSIEDLTHAMSAYEEHGEGFTLDSLPTPVPSVAELWTRFRSASIDTEKSPSFNLPGDEASGRTRSYSAADEGDRKESLATASHPSPGESVWVTSASHPSPFSASPSGSQGQQHAGSRVRGSEPGYLSNLSLQSTPVTMAAASNLSARPKTGSQHVGSPGTSTLTAQELHDSVLSALTESSSLGATGGSPSKSPLERKLSKQKPKGCMEYTVKDGDTLVKIGAHFDVTPSELMKLNKMLSRTVFTGQTLFVPDPDYVPIDPPTPITSPNTDVKPKTDTQMVNLGDRPLQAVPGHAVPVSSPSKPSASAKVVSPKIVVPKAISPKPAARPKSPKARTLSIQNDDEDETDKECLQKFVKMPVRRVMEEADDDIVKEGFTIKGTLLVTPNAIMFDPDVNDVIVIEKNGQLKFSMVVYMEEIKSVALFHDISPRMFWRQPKELRAHSPKPEAYRSNQGKRPKVDGEDAKDSETRSKSPSPVEGSTRQAPDGASAGAEGGLQRASPDGGDPSDEGKGETATGRTSEELENLPECTGPCHDSTPQPGRASEEVEHALTRSQGYTPTSPLVKQMSRSSELAVSEISLLGETSQTFGETRDFGPHMGRSSTEAHIQTPNTARGLSESSPGDVAGRAFFPERSDSTSDSLHTPTQGFAPLHFTDRSPKSVLAHPTPVSGQRAMPLPQSPVPSSDLKSQENRIDEAAESTHLELQGSGEFEVSTDAQLSADDSSNDFSNTRNLSAEDANTDQSLKSASKDDKPSAKTDQELTPAAGIVSDSTQTGNTTYEETEGQVFRYDTGNLEGEATQPEGVQDPANLKNDDGKDDEAKAQASSPRSSFSPLRAPVQQISSFISYTSNLLRGSGSALASSASASSNTNGKGKNKAVSPSRMPKLQLKSGFTKEDIAKVLGPEPTCFLPKSDSPHFEQAPMYLQIRPGIKKKQDEDVANRQPRAFDHRNPNKLLEEYWFVIPIDMADKLYNFLMEWQPDAYGDQDETCQREKFFYDQREVMNLIQPIGKKGSCAEEKAGGDTGLPVCENHFSEMEKTWEILSKEEVYSAEEAQILEHQDTIDESNFPEVVGGPTQILATEHIASMVKSIPRVMSAGYNWELIFATHKHGYSLQNLYTKMDGLEDDSPLLIFIRDTHRAVFGAYISNIMRVSETFYGSGSTFLFTFYPSFKKFGWQGDNQFFLNGAKDSFAVGSGEGVFGLWLDGDLNKGRSHCCPTFHNDILSTVEDFNILDVEVFRFIDSSLM